MSHLEKNLKAFDALKPSLAGEAGRFAIMRDEKLVETFDSSEDAHKYAAAVFGDKNYSVHRICGVEIPLNPNGNFKVVIEDGRQKEVPKYPPTITTPFFYDTGTPVYPTYQFYYKSNTC